MNRIYEQIERLKLVPVIKIDDPETAIPLARALREGGLPCAEVTFRTEHAESAIRSIHTAFPDMLVGAGTVLTVEQVQRAMDAGAQFIVSPGLNPDVVRYCTEHGILILPGCATPSDVEKAIGFGLPVVKFFPAESAGGLAMIKAMSAPYPQIRFMPTGEISPKNVKEYLACPAVFACGGSWMVKGNLIREGRFAEITQLCRSAMELIHGTEKSTPLQSHLPVAFPAFSSDRPLDACGLGELLLRISSDGKERIADGHPLFAYPGGAELNVMAGLSLLGLKTAILSKLPHNQLGDLLRTSIRQKGVSTAYLDTDESASARLGLYFYEPGAAPRKSRAVYDRQHSSFTTFSCEEIPADAFESTSLFFTSGISLAVSPFNAEQTIQTLARFKKAGSIIAFDVNYRASLWREEEAREKIERVLPLVDILFVSEESSRRMFHKTGTLQEILKSYAVDNGISIVASTQRTIVSPQCHHFTSLIYHAPEDAFYTEEPYRNIEVVDRIGSGDSYIAGVLYGILKYRDLQQAIAFGNAYAVLSCTEKGDLPAAGLDDVAALIQEHHSDAPISEMVR